METAHLPNGTLLQGGKYKIVRFIGSGGFGCTYEGEHTMLGSKVAIKEFFVKDFCDRDGSTSHITVSTSGKRELVDKLKGKFVEEARATSRMQHPNIVKVYDVFEENGAAYYVMDYIEGTSLEKVVKESGPLSEQTALKYIRQVADALGYVHSLNRLHLDLKPGNIMIDGYGNAVLVDFGASKQYDEAGGENTSTLIGKTPGYAPIEQMGNSVSTFSPATDIYALGATLYKLLTGVTPPGSNLLASGEELAPLPSNISASTSNAISAAMKIARRERPQSVAEFLSLLDSAEAGTTSTAKKSLVGAKTISEETVFDDNHKKSESPDSHPLWKEPISEPKPDFHSQLKPPQKKKSRKGGWGVLIFLVVVAVAILLATWTPSVKEWSVRGTGQTNGHDYVDMGLSVKWATCNVGASFPSGYGDYYAWGETKTKSNFNEKNSASYCKSYKDIAGDSKYDVARASWGDNWRMPTSEEMRKLVDECTWKWRKMNGIKGYLVTSPNGNSIFLPAAGIMSYNNRHWLDEGGYYWCSVPYIDTTISTSLFFHKKEFLSEKRIRVESHLRYFGCSVRPVLAQPTTSSKTSQTSTKTTSSSSSTANKTSSTASSSGSTTSQQGSKQTTTQTSPPSTSSSPSKTTNQTPSTTAASATPATPVTPATTTTQQTPTPIDAGALLSTKKEDPEPEQETIPFQLVEVKPSFMGGDANAFTTWVNQHLVYPEIAKNNGVQGRVTLQFTVGADGIVSNVNVIRSVDSSLDKEAVRVVSMSPKWTPGRHKGKPVAVTYTFPVVFALR